MNRRNLLKGILGVGAVGIAGKAVIEEPVTEPLPLIDKEMENKYWQAQRHIDELEAELNKPSLADKLRAAGFKPINRRGDLI